MSTLDAQTKPNSSLDAALDEARERYAAARPKSAAIHAKARARLPGGNTRSVLFYKPFPTAMAGGDGCWLTDVDGHRYLDLCGEYSAGLFGHSEPRILEAVRRALEGGVNLAAVGENEGRLAELICGRFPSIERVRFTNSGTEANMMALGAARAFTGRTRVVGFHGGYHGGLLTFAFGQGALNAPFPITLCDYGDADAVEAALAPGDAAAVIVEPMLGGGGCIPAPPGFLAQLRRATSAAGTLLVFDEVMTSRHGAAGLQARSGVIPDLTTLGKYVAGGMSFGAFGGRADVMDQFDGHRPGAQLHSGTFNNNVLSMAAGVAAMTLFDGAAAEAHLAAGEALRDALNKTCKMQKAALCFTGVGSMMQPHFRREAPDRPYRTSPRDEGLRELFFFDMLAAGIYLARRGMAALSLPTGPSERARYVSAVEEFCVSRAPLLAQS